MVRFLRIVYAAVAVLAIAACGSSPQTARPYPVRNINVTVFSSQGGGSDRWARHLALLMEKDLGVHIICSNLPGANGGSGAMKVWSARHDGYSVLGASETAMFFGVNAVAPTADQWEFFIAGGSPGVLAVHHSAPYSTIQDFVGAARNQARKIKIGNSGQGKLWNIKAVQFERAAGVEFQHVPYNGSGPAITALLGREVDAVSCSAGEVVEYVRGGLVRPLIITETYSMEMEPCGTIPSAAELYPERAKDFRDLFQWLGFMMPADVPSEVLETFGRAFDQAVRHPKTEELARAEKVRLLALRGKEAKDMALRMQSVASWFSKELGLARKDPAELGIPKPE
ncbi:MAG: tripartite tricarboxylate transporter substrate binding protein [Candidatus Sumerlaeia bacterium]|nr:tripartite tricarboxylate transporter substrate binding protein [Candidatus Sumerlaeia bacterium]